MAQETDSEMSFDLGKDAGFNPPPPPMKRLSPWVGIGCAALLMGSVVGSSMVAISNFMKKEMEKPIDKEAVLAELGDTPLYPKVQFDEQVTKAARVGPWVFGLAKSVKPRVVAGFRTEKTAPEVYAWYDDKLAAAGFLKERGQDRNQQIYRRGDELIMVQVRKDRGEATGLILMRFSGVEKRYRKFLSAPSPQEQPRS